MTDVLRQYNDLKVTVESLSDKVNRARGKCDSFLEQLHRAGYDSPDDATAAINQMQTDLDEMQTVLAQKQKALVTTISKIDSAMVPVQPRRF